MSRVIILLIIVFIGLKVHRSGALDDLSYSFRSKESLQQELVNKQQELSQIQQGLRTAQANAPHCGGKQMKLTVSGETKADLEELRADISELRILIAQK